MLGTSAEDLQSAPRSPRPRSNAPEVTNRPVPRSRPQIRQKRLGDVQRAEDVCVERVKVVLGRRLLDRADEHVPRGVDEVRDVPVLVVCFFRRLLELFKGSGDVQRDDGGALFAEGLEFGHGAAAGDDVVAAGEGVEGHVVAEAGAGSGDEPDGGLGCHFWSGGGEGLERGRWRRDGLNCNGRCCAAVLYFYMGLRSNEVRNPPSARPNFAINLRYILRTAWDAVFSPVLVIYAPCQAGSTQAPVLCSASRG